MMRPLFYGLIKHDFFLLPSQQGLDSWELAACTCVVTGPFLVSVFFPFLLWNGALMLYSSQNSESELELYSACFIYHVMRLKETWVT